MSEIHLTPEQLKTVSPELSDKFPDGAVVTFDENNNRRLGEPKPVACERLACGFYDDQRPKPEGSILKQHEEFHRQSTPTPAAPESQVGDEGEIDNRLEALEQVGDYSITKALSERLAAVERRLDEVENRYETDLFMERFPGAFGWIQNIQERVDALEDKPQAPQPAAPSIPEYADTVETPDGYPKQPAAPDSQTKQIGHVLEVAGGREALAKSLKYPAGKPAAPAKQITPEQVEDIITTACQDDGELKYLMDYPRITDSLNGFFR